MTRVNVHARLLDDPHGEPELAGWFDPDSAEAFKADTVWDGNNHRDVNTGSQWDHQILYRTAGGRWVLHEWSQWQGRGETYEFIGGDRARDWLLRNHEDTIVARFFGPIEPERGPGRPEVGPAVNVRLTPELLARLDAHAAERGVTRAAAIRATLDAHLSEQA